MRLVQTSALEIRERVGQTSGLFDVKGNQLYVEVAGEGFPMIFLHDGNADSRGFDYQFKNLAGRYTAIRYDREGYGSSKPPMVPYSEVNDLKSICDQLGLSSAILVGGSAGGRLAINFAITHPRYTAALILVGAAISGFSFTDHMWYRGWRQEFGDSIPDYINFWVNDPWFVAEENQAARIRLREILESSTQNLENFPVEKLPDISALPRLSEIQCPTLIVVGEHDIADNHAHAGVLEVSIKGAERKVVTHSGHLVYLEQPEAFNAIVTEFLEKAFPATSGMESPLPPEEN
jgi:pimeloyl-ACP methyl ester carboxylesterase